MDDESEVCMKSEETIESAIKRANDCFARGMNSSCNPYRNLPVNNHNSELLMAFDERMESLSFEKCLASQRSSGIIG